MTSPTLTRFAVQWWKGALLYPGYGYQFNQLFSIRLLAKIHDRAKLIPFTFYLLPFTANLR